MSDENEKAPDFTLEVANGDQLVLSDIWKDSHLLLWFSRGLACPFCRRQIIQMTKIHPQLLDAGVVTVQVTPTAMDVAKSMLEFYSVPWPYACDPGGHVSKAYEMGPRGPLQKLTTTLNEQRWAWGAIVKHPTEPHPEILPLVKEHPPESDIDGGVVIIAPGGFIRFRLPTGKLSLLPSNDSLLKAVRKLVEQAA